MIVVHAGNRVDDPRRDTPRFPPGRDKALRQRFDALLDLLAPDGVVTSAAAGADLVLIEAALARSLPVHLVLPCAAERFRATSVAEQGTRWVQAYDRALAALAAGAPGSLRVRDLAPDDDVYRAGNTALLERARDLAPGRVLAVAVRPRFATGSSSVTDDFVAQAEAAGLFVVEIDPMTC